MENSVPVERKSQCHVYPIYGLWSPFSIAIQIKGYNLQMGQNTKLKIEKKVHQKSRAKLNLLHRYGPKHSKVQKLLSINFFLNLLNLNCKQKYEPFISHDAQVMKMYP